MQLKVVLIAIAGLGLAANGPLTGSCQPPAVNSQQLSAPQLVILDTDIGDDIDDAFALALLLRSPEVKLLGVTTAFGDTELRARLVDRYLAAVGRNDIPVMAGVQTPANNVFTQAAYAKQGTGSPLDRLLFDHCAMGLRSESQIPIPRRKKEQVELCKKERHDGVGFILRIAAEFPGQVTLIAIGPLFNVQAAIERDPAAFRKLRRVVLMGGSIYRGYGEEDPGGAGPPPSSEWNIRCDPAAARALLASGVPVFMLPLDSTQIHLAPEQLATILAHGSPLTDQLTLLYHQWTGISAWNMPTLFDPVAAATAIRPDLCPMQAMHVEVDDQGITRPTDGKPNVQVCLRSDRDEFLKFLLERILSDPAH
ncbi:MAG TPA: nucleoside hydrolase [Terracidiphilus sp.]|jgi:inosine-uridine nucleoside N-ribohydrolase